MFNTVKGGRSKHVYVMVNVFAIAWIMPIRNLQNSLMHLDFTKTMKTGTRVGKVKT